MMRTRDFSTSLSFLLLLFLVTLLASSAATQVRAQQQQHTRESSYQLQHAFGDGQWEDCGLLKTRVTEKGHQTSGGKKGFGKKAVFHGIKVAYDPLSKESRAKLEKAVQSDGLYQLRISTTAVGGGKNKKKAASGAVSFLVTSMKASCLAAAKYKDHLNLHFDELGETLISADHTASNVDCLSVSTTHSQLSDEKVTVERIGPTTSSIKFSKVAPALSVTKRRKKSSRRGVEADNEVDGATDLRYEDDDDDDDEETKEPPKDERTWVQKNWMLVLAGGMMAVNLMGSALEPSRQQQQRGRGQGQQSR